MKTTIKIILLALSSFGISCSSNDDNNSITQYRVKQMTSVSTSIPTSNQTVTFNYDGQNRISNYVVTKASSTLTHNITYNSNGRISEISRTAASSSTSTTIPFQFVYSGEILTQLIIPGTSSSPTTTMNFTYNASQNKYIGNDGVGTVVEIRLDTNGNIIQFVSSIENNMISYNTNSGIFNPSINNLPLFLTHVFSSEGNTKYIVQLFSNKEIVAIEGATSTLTTTTTRGEANRISQIRYLNGTMPILTIDFAFEEFN